MQQLAEQSLGKACPNVRGCANNHSRGPTMRPVTKPTRLVKSIGGVTSVSSTVLASRREASKKSKRKNGKKKTR